MGARAGRREPATFARADLELSALCFEEIRRSKVEDGATIDYGAAARVVMAREPELARRWQRMPDEHYAGG